MNQNLKSEHFSLKKKKEKKKTTGSPCFELHPGDANHTFTL